jgi:hypothetical protein
VSLADLLGLCPPAAATINFAAASAAAAQRGRAFQSSFNSLFNLEENTTKLFTNVGNTVPDLYVEDVALAELKSGAYVYNTAQIEAQIAAATSEGVPYYLIVPPTTEVAGTTSAAVAGTGGQVIIYDATAGTIEAAEGGSVALEFLEFLALAAL